MSARVPLRERTGVRPEIQALRAVAVTAVVIGHVWPRFAPAGFIGVDVFFVISGFLITSQLLQERERSGRISLRGFYGRRIRRLLPAATVVLAFSTAMTLLFVPRELWRQFLGEIVASQLYVQNWFLASQGGRVEQGGQDDSPLVHFWSLSVEEQFYLVWPLVILLGYLAVRALGRRGLRTIPVFAVLLGAVTAVSLIYCIVLSVADSQFAYYSTFARAWEFGLGGLIALLPLSTTFLTPRQRAVISWLGVLLIVGTVVAWTDPAPFPGIAALLPAAGAAAVIVAGAPEVSWGTLGLARLRPVQWLGDASYSLYLWHWPIIAFLPFVTGVPTPWYFLVGVLGVCVAVSALSLRFVENPIRFRSPGFVAHRRAVGISYIAVASGSLVCCVVGVLATR